jgi:hypothetical protein
VIDLTSHNGCLLFDVQSDQSSRLKLHDKLFRKSLPNAHTACSRCISRFAVTADMFIGGVRFTFHIGQSCRSSGISEIQLDLVALQILLAHLTGTEDPVIGVGRALGKACDVMSIRLKLKPKDSIDEVLALTKATVCSAQQHSHVPIQTLLNPLNVSKQSLIHQVTYNWQGESSDTLRDVTIFY